MKGRVAALAVLLTLVSTISPAEPPARRASHQLFEVHLLQLSDSPAGDTAAAFQLFRTPPAHELELEAPSTPPLPPVRDVLAPLGSFELFYRLGRGDAGGTLDAMLRQADGDRLLLQGVPTSPWFEETHEVGRFFSVQYSEGPLCGTQDPHRLLGAN